MSKELENLFRKDQQYIGKFAKYTKKEYLRLNKALQDKIKDIKLRSGRDYFIAAMIFQHGFTILSSKKAIKYARLAVRKGYKKGKWLIASAIDRLLQLQGKPQKFGTQVISMKAKKLKLYRLNPETTDGERKKYGLPTLDQIKNIMT